MFSKPQFTLGNVLSCISFCELTNPRPLFPLHLRDALKCTKYRCKGDGAGLSSERGSHLLRKKQQINDKLKFPDSLSPSYHPASLSLTVHIRGWVDQGSPASLGELILTPVPCPLSCANKNCSVCLGKEAQSHSWARVCLHNTLKSLLKRQGERKRSLSFQ